jgi:uncharacterized RDD family membrane protein YckC
MATLSGGKAVAKGGGLTAQDFFPFLIVPPQFCFVAAILSLFYAIGVPVASYIRNAEFLLSDLTLYYLIGAWIFYLAGLAVRQLEREGKP